MKLRLQNKYKSIDTLNEIELPNFIVLTGLNGSGKTQLLKGINERHIIPYDEESKILSNENPYYKNGQISSKYIDFKSKLSNIQSFSSDKDKQHYIAIINALNENGNIPNIINGIDYNRNADYSFKLNEVRTVFEKSKLPANEFSYKDFLILRNQYINKQEIFGLPNFSQIIVSYYERKLHNQYQEFLHSKDNTIKYLSEREFLEKYGEDPVDLFNKYLKMMNKKFELARPNYTEIGTPYTAKLINSVTGDAVQLSDLSTGETVFFQLLTTLFNNDSETLNIPKILLLDEMDAGLHPNLIRKLLNDIDKILVKDMGITVIMTTHSPTTVALSDEEALYMMMENNPRINKITKQKALDMLTIGIPTLKIDYNYRRQVLVESDYDAKNYDSIYRILQDSNYITSEIGLNFISSGSNKSAQSGSCDLVKTLVKKFLGAGNDKIYGITDYDNHNVSNSSEHIYCLAEGSRYAIENCILDPLAIGILLMTDGFIEKYKFPITKLSDIYKETEKYQDIVDIVIDKLEFDKINLCKVKTVGGYEYQVPKQLLTMVGHDLEKLYKDKIPELKKYYNINSLIDRTIFIFQSYEKIIPKEFLDILKVISE